MPDFEVFTKRMGTLAKTPAVTIQKRGLISLNASAHHALGDPETVELLYDSSDRVLGLRPCAREVPHAYRFRVIGGESSPTFILSGTAFCKYYAIPMDESRRWPAAVSDGILCVDLNAEPTVVTSNRAPKLHFEEND